jgi:hypothetical protein
MLLLFVIIQCKLKEEYFLIRASSQGRDRNYSTEKMPSELGKFLPMVFFVFGCIRSRDGYFNEKYQKALS